MGFWNFVENLYEKAGDAYEKFKSSDLVSNYNDRMYRNVEDRANKVLSNPSAYTEEQFERAKEYKDQARSARKGEWQSPEPNEVDYYENYEAEQAKLIAQNKYRNCIIMLYLSDVPFWQHIEIYDKIAENGMPDDQKELLDGLGISHSYYARLSTLRELYRVLSNPLACEFIKDGSKGDVSEFSEYVEAQVCEGVSEAYDDKLAAFSSLTDDSAEVVSCILAEEYPTPEVDGSYFIPLLIYADNGLVNLDERGFVIYGFCQYSGDNLYCKQLQLSIKNSEDDYCFFPLAEIYKIESKRNAVIINDQYTIRTSGSNDNEFGEYDRSQILAYILNLYLLNEWEIREAPSLIPFKLQEVSHLANNKLADKVFFDEKCFLEFLMGTQDSKT